MCVQACFATGFAQDQFVLELCMRLALYVYGNLNWEAIHWCAIRNLKQEHESLLGWSH